MRHQPLFIPCPERHKLAIQIAIGVDKNRLLQSVQRILKIGTHRGTFMGIPATGKSVVMTGMTMVRIVDGRLLESWVKNDVMGLLATLKG